VEIDSTPKKEQIIKHTVSCAMMAGNSCFATASAAASLTRSTDKKKNTREENMIKIEGTNQIVIFCENFVSNGIKNSQSSAASHEKN
jgi:hypothetical protein